MVILFIARNFLVFAFSLEFFFSSSAARQKPYIAFPRQVKPPGEKDRLRFMYHSLSSHLACYSYFFNFNLLSLLFFDVFLFFHKSFNCFQPLWYVQQFLYTQILVSSLQIGPEALYCRAFCEYVFYRLNFIIVTVASIVLIHFAPQKVVSKSSMSSHQLCYF